MNDTTITNPTSTDLNNVEEEIENLLREKTAIERRLYKLNAYLKDKTSNYRLAWVDLNNKEHATFEALGSGLEILDWADEPCESVEEATALAIDLFKLFYMDIKQIYIINKEGHRILRFEPNFNAYVYQIVEKGNSLLKTRKNVCSTKSCKVAMEGAVVINTQYASPSCVEMELSVWHLGKDKGKGKGNLTEMDDCIKTLNIPVYKSPYYKALERANW